MKKLVSAFLIVAILCSHIVAGASQLESEYEPDIAYAETSVALFENLGFSLPTLDFDDTVIALDFTALLLNLFGVSTENISETEIINRAGALNFAIPGYDYSKEITYSEAAMMCVAAAGFVPEAGLSGGYTAGSAVIAKKMKLLRAGAYSYDSAMTYADVLYMVETLGTVNIRYQSQFGDTLKYSVTEGYNPFYIYHNVYIVEGIINANEYSSVYLPSGACGEGKIQIDETVYNYDGESVLGEKVTAYIRDNSSSDSVICFRNDSSETVVYGEDVFDVDTKYITYSDNGKEKKKSLDNPVLVVYNGKAYPECKVDEYKISDGYLTLIDNDEDGRIDVIHIREYRIIYVKSNDTYGGVISDKNSGYYLNYSSSDSSLKIWNAENRISPETVKKGAVLEVYSSKDGKFSQMNMSNNKTVTGTVTELDNAGGHIAIDGVMYSYNRYFDENYLKYCTLSKKVSVTTDNFGKLSVLSSETGNDFPYALLIAVRKETGLNPKVEVKIFAEDDEIKVYEVAESVKVDGVVMTNTDFNAHFDTVEPGSELIIRYKLKGNKLSEVVTPSRSSEQITEEQAETELVRYMFTGTFVNKDGDRYGTMFYTNSTTPIFSIYEGEGISEDKKYTTSEPVSSGRYNDGVEEIEAYNVSTLRKAGAIIYRKGGTVSYLNQDSPKGLVISVTEAMVPYPSGDSFPGRKVTLCYDGVFSEYYMTDDYPWRNVVKAHPDDKYPINPGDVIRYAVNSNGHITDMSKDFEFKTRTIYNNATIEKGLFYMFGKVIHIDGSIAVIDNTTDSDIYDQPNLKGTSYMPLPANAVMFDTKLGKVVDPIYSIDSIRTSKYSLKDCDFVLCTTIDGYGPKVIIYR